MCSRRNAAWVSVSDASGASHISTGSQTESTTPGPAGSGVLSGSGAAVESVTAAGSTAAVPDLEPAV
jgi:hypothetical protein